MSGWRVHYADPVHVWPAADAVEHDPADEDCVCGPEVIPVERRDGTTGWVYRHHSLDGRESR